MCSSLDSPSCYGVLARSANWDRYGLRLRSVVGGVGRPLDFDIVLGGAESQVKKGLTVSLSVAMPAATFTYVGR